MHSQRGRELVLERKQKHHDSSWFVALRRATRVDRWRARVLPTLQGGRLGKSPKTLQRRGRGRGGAGGTGPGSQRPAVGRQLVQRALPRGLAAQAVRAYSSRTALCPDCDEDKCMVPVFLFPLSFCFLSFSHSASFPACSLLSLSFFLLCPSLLVRCLQTR